MMIRGVVLVPVMMTVLLSFSTSSGADNYRVTDCITAPLKSSQDGAGDNKNNEADSFEHAYAEAECLRLVAASIDAEWLRTEAILKSARVEAANNNWDEAFRLVSKARLQAEASLGQANNEARAWMRRVVR